jgi:hypothetical protein
MTIFYIIVKQFTNEELSEQMGFWLHLFQA